MATETKSNYDDSVVNIKVVGVGGGGNNAVNRMIASNVRGVEFIAINTDRQSLAQSQADYQIPIGSKLTKGHGAGANPDVGARAVEENKEEIMNALKGADMAFITAGMGGGTGTGAAPVVAKIAKDMGILTIGIVTKPFAFEGPRRMKSAEEGIARLRDNVDSLVIIPNERLKQVSDTKITLLNAFAEADDVLRRGVQSISELINIPGIINLDFADVTAVMANAGCAHMGVGKASGENKAEEAAKMAISSPLLETTIQGAKGILINVTISPDISLDDINTACSMIAEEADPDAVIIFGAAFDNNLEDTIQITVIATGFNGISESENQAAQNLACKMQAEEKPPVAEEKAPVMQAVKEEEPREEEEDGPVDAAPEESISESDFDDIMNILRKTKH